jgi:D-alanyl-lipoteichoic acid acyltransferase DltB (MBOAT superfamily)
MLFNSADYVLAFLPICFFAYFWLNASRLAVFGKAWLVAASLFFYGWWNPVYLPLMVASILFNFAIGSRLARARVRGFQPRTSLLAFGVLVNLGVLGYFKYASFLVGNLNALSGAQLALPSIVLPLAVSFFTFTQIAYLVDSHKGIAREYSLLNYFLFVTFFPHLVAGPILHHKEMMPQFASRWTLPVRYPNIALGLMLISLGLFKKAIIADGFAQWATAGFDQAATLNFFEAWVSSLSYTFQLYFDFCGYTDMAIGSALLFNIRLPINFNSPYRALNVRDFWRRWHMTLSRFLRDYVYIPLGGSGAGAARMYVALLVTFVLGGLWHGASWMFVIWGALHGVAMVLHRAWSAIGLRMPKILAWFVTFNFINLTWVFFRAKEMKDAVKVLRGMAGLDGLVLPHQLTLYLPQLGKSGLAFGPWIAGIGADYRTVLMLIGAFILVLGFRNTSQLAAPSANAPLLQYRWALLCAVLGSVSLVSILASTYSEFIYFNF